MTDIRGVVDTLEGSYLSGWAYDADAFDRTCRIEVEDEAGQVIAQGRASRQRPDLAALGSGRSDFAFRILLPAITNSARLKVCADSIALANSPVHVGPGLFDGDASFKEGIISGWVTERIIGFAPPMIEARDQDGRLLARQTATLEAATADQNYRPARFALEVPNWAFVNKSLYVSMAANGVVFATCESPLRTIGYLDIVTQSRCAGWLYSPDAPWRKFSIEVRHEGALVGTGPCILSRPDITAAHPTAYAAGFDFPLYTEWTAGSSYELSFRLTGSDCDLFGGPFLAVTRAGVVSLARAANQAARRSTDTKLAVAGRSLLHAAMRDVAQRARSVDRLELIPVAKPGTSPCSATRLTIIIPVYRGIEETRRCIESVLCARCEQSDRILIIADKPPEPAMLGMLGYFAAKQNIVLRSNNTNLGFIGSVNRALRLCLSGDVLLLNSDTKMFSGALDEMLDVLHSSPDIGTVTALSNNATIFSYPHPSLRATALEFSDWAPLAAVALTQNKGLAIDVPTGHGFCMLIRADVLSSVAELDETFGRGYGEENDFCQRAADLGYRHVAACGVLVEHSESVSFSSDKALLLKTNLAILESRYPEYTPMIMDFEREDPLRLGRRALDLHRLGQVAGHFLVVVEAWFGGGSRKAANDLTARILQPGQSVISVRCLPDSRGIEVFVQQPLIKAQFAESETEDLIKLLDMAAPTGVIVHQLVGYKLDFIEHLTAWLSRIPSIIYQHDFYAICPRVTMINSVATFCGAAATDICERCIAMGGEHPHSQLHLKPVSRHRALFGRLLQQASKVVTPSADTALWVNKIFPSIPIDVVEHPTFAPPAVSSSASRTRTNFLIVGAIGPHKGSQLLLDMAQNAKLSCPDLRFTVIGYTDRDTELMSLGNVAITGAYDEDQLPELINSSDAAAALFLHNWPETFSYTLTEVARLGLIPLVPNIGAPAARVKSAHFGIVYDFPTTASSLLELLASFAAGRIGPGEGNPAALCPPADTADHLIEVFCPIP